MRFCLLIVLVTTAACAPSQAAVSTPMGADHSIGADQPLETKQPISTDQPIGLQPTAPLAPKVIPFFTTESDPKQLAVLRELILEYQQLNPGIEVDIVLASPSSRGSRLLTALASGADLGIFEIEPTLISQWIEAGYLLPLDDVAGAIGDNDFVAGSLFRQNERVYAVPYAISVYGLWIRTDLLKQAGLELPRNYAELLQAAKSMTKGNVYGLALPAGQNIATVNYFSIFLWQNGGDYFTCDGNLAFGNAATLEAIQRWADLAQYAPPGYTTWGYREQIDSFLNGRVAMAIYGGRLGVQIDESNPQLAKNVTVIFPPFGDQHVTLGVWSRFAIAAGTKNQAESKAFLQWLISGDRLLRYDLTMPGHMIPPLKSVRAAALADASDYARRHADWIRAFYQWAALTNHPAMNMGSIRAGQFERSDQAPRWAWEIFGQPGIVDTMLQEIALGVREADAAWKSAAEKMTQTITAWKNTHPAWQAPACTP
jgi:ABC-type glycerol-3-phosphate transport system substrate-binding protein